MNIFNDDFDNCFNMWNSNTMMMEFRNLQTIENLLKSKRCHIVRSLFEKFPDDRKVAAMYEIQESYGLFRECLPLVAAKRADESENLRNAGNECYKNGAFEDALLLYNRCIAVAPKNGSELAFGYGNRSLVSLKLARYEAAILDANRALQGACPDKLKKKLLQRRSTCVNELKKVVRARNSGALGLARSEVERVIDENATEPDFTKRSQVPSGVFKHPLLPNASEKLKLNVEDSGAYFTTTTNIKAGEILMTEKAFASILVGNDTLNHCSVCYAWCAAPIPCEGCASVMFCSQRCRNEALDAYHRVECEYMAHADSINLNPTTRLCLRILLVAAAQGKSLNELLEQTFVTDASSPLRLDPTKKFSADYASVCSLPAAIVLETKDFQLRTASHASVGLHVLKKSSFFDGITDVSPLRKKVYGDVTLAESLVGTLIWKHWIALSLHQSTIMEKIEIAKPLDPLVALVRCISFQNRIGDGVYPLLGHMGHSCDPNVGRFQHGDTTIVFALRPINANEKLFDTYGVHYKDVPLGERKQILAKYHCKCECKACLNDWPVFWKLPSLDLNGKTEFKRKFKKDTERVLFIFANPQFIENELKFLCEYSGTLHRLVKRPLKLFVELEKAIREALSVRGNVVRKFHVQKPISEENLMEWYFDELFLH